MQSTRSGETHTWSMALVPRPVAWTVRPHLSAAYVWISVNPWAFQTSNCGSWEWQLKSPTMILGPYAFRTRRSVSSAKRASVRCIVSMFLLLAAYPYATPTFNHPLGVWTAAAWMRPVSHWAGANSLQRARTGRCVMTPTPVHLPPRQLRLPVNGGAGAPGTNLTPLLDLLGTLVCEVRFTCTPDAGRQLFEQISFMQDTSCVKGTYNECVRWSRMQSFTMSLAKQSPWMILGLNNRIEGQSERE